MHVGLTQPFKNRIRLRGKWNESMFAARVDASGNSLEETLVWASENQVIENKYPA